jgi:hypothetical protein
VDCGITRASDPWARAQQINVDGCPSSYFDQATRYNRLIFIMNNMMRIIIRFIPSSNVNIFMLFCVKIDGMPTHRIEKDGDDVYLAVQSSMT